MQLRGHYRKACNHGGIMHVPEHVRYNTYCMQAHFASKEIRWDRDEFCHHGGSTAEPPPSDPPEVQGAPAQLLRGAVNEGLNITLPAPHILRNSSGETCKQCQKV